MRWYGCVFPDFSESLLAARERAISGMKLEDNATFSTCLQMPVIDSFMRRASTPCPMQRESTDASMLSNEPVALVRALAASTTFPLFFTRTATSALSSPTLLPRRRFSPWADEHVWLFLVSSFCNSSSWSWAASCFSSIFPTLVRSSSCWTLS